MPPTPETSWYFAYGSNMSPAIFLERRGMHPLATRRARLDDHRLCFDIPIGSGARGVANVEPRAGAHVWGVAYLLTADEQDRLDHTEGVDRGLYARILVEVFAGDERMVAITYRSPLAAVGRKPSPRYIGLLLDGARHHELPAGYVAALDAVERAVDERQRDAAPAR